MRERVRNGADEGVIGEVEKLEMSTVGNIGGERGVDEVVVEGEECERREAAEDGGERSGEVEVGEVEGSDVAGVMVAGDGGPLAGRGITWVPVEKRVGGVGEKKLGLKEEETVLGERESEEGRRREKENEKKEEKHGV